jgi:hypothetical protein
MVTWVVLSLVLAWSNCPLGNAIGDALPGLAASLVDIPGGRSRSRPGSEVDRSLWQWHDASATTAMRAAAPAPAARPFGRRNQGDSCFECLVVFDVFQSDNDGFGRQSVPNCISPRPPLRASVFGPVLLSALSRLGSIFWNEVIGVRGRRPFCRRSSSRRCLDQEPCRLCLPGMLPLRLQCH